MIVRQFEFKYLRIWVLYHAAKLRNGLVEQGLEVVGSIFLQSTHVSRRN